VIFPTAKLVVALQYMFCVVHYALCPNLYNVPSVLVNAVTYETVCVCPKRLETCGLPPFLGNKIQI